MIPNNTKTLETNKILNNLFVIIEMFHFTAFVPNMSKIYYRISSKVF